MQRHTKIYFDFFGYDISDFIACEVPNCTGATAIHHIERRGMGGDPKGKKDVIENLMAICEKHHEEFGDKKQHKEYLIKIHLDKINGNSRTNIS